MPPVRMASRYCGAFSRHSARVTGVFTTGLSAERVPALSSMGGDWPTRAWVRIVRLAGVCLEKAKTLSVRMDDDNYDFCASLRKNKEERLCAVSPSSAQPFHNLVDGPASPLRKQSGRSSLYLRYQPPLTA